MLYLCRVKPLRHYLRGFLIAAWAGDKCRVLLSRNIISFSLRPWFFFVSPAYAKSPARFSSPRRCGITPHVRGKAGTL